MSNRPEALLISTPTRAERLYNPSGTMDGFIQHKQVNIYTGNNTKQYLYDHNLQELRLIKSSSYAGTCSSAAHLINNSVFFLLAFLPEVQMLPVGCKTSSIIGCTGKAGGKLQIGNTFSVFDK